MEIQKIIPPGFKKESLFKLMQEHHLNGVLLTSAENVYYTTGYPALPGTGNPIIFALQNQTAVLFLYRKRWQGDASGLDSRTQRD